MPIPNSDFVPDPFPGIRLPSGTGAPGQHDDGLTGLTEHTIQPAAVALFRGFLTARRGRLAATTGPGGPDASAAGHRE